MRTKTPIHQRLPARDRQDRAQAQHQGWLWQVQRKTSRSTVQNHCGPVATSTAQAQAEAETLARDAPPLERAEDPTPSPAVGEDFPRHPERDSLQRSAHAEMAGSAVGQRPRRIHLTRSAVDPERGRVALGDPRRPFVHHQGPTHQSWVS